MSFLSASFSSEATIRQRLPAGAASLLRIPVTGECVRHKERWGGEGRGEGGGDDTGEKKML